MQETDIWVDVRANIRALFAAAKAGLRKGPRSPLELEAESDVGKSTIYRLLDPKQKEAVGLGNLAALARGFGLPAWALLVHDLPAVGKPIATTAEQIEVLAERRANEMFEEALNERKRLSVKGRPGKGGVDDPYALGKASKTSPKGRATAKSKRRQAA